MLDMFGACNFSRFRELPSRSDWTEERIAELRKLHASGASYSAIADALGTTRNAVSGKIDRLGLGGHRKEARRSYPQTRHRKSKAERVIRFRNSQPVSVDLVEYEERPVTNEFRCIPLLDLEDGMCRFPRGEGLDTVFCGRPAQQGISYCAGCAKICFNPKATAASSAKGATYRDMGARYRAALRDAPL